MPLGWLSSRFVHQVLAALSQIRLSLQLSLGDFLWASHHLCSLFFPPKTRDLLIKLCRCEKSIHLPLELPKSQETVKREPARLQSTVKVHPRLFTMSAGGAPWEQAGGKAAAVRKIMIFYLHKYSSHESCSQLFAILKGTLERNLATFAHPHLICVFLSDLVW